MPTSHPSDDDELGELLLDIGVMLMVSGANTERIKITERIANAFA